MASDSEDVEALREAVHRITSLLASAAYGAVVRSCSESRLNADDLRAVVDAYGRQLIPAPEDAYVNLDAVRVVGARWPTWSVRAPLYTAEEGMFDLTLELTIRQIHTSVEIELDDLHVL